MSVRAAALLACLLAAAPAHAREHHEHASDAKHHLDKANALAGDGKCAAAVKEYTAAYEKLQDPVLLFNRGECYRRLGENAKAADDYRGFLKGFPAAPNRAELEARIATLEKPPAPKPVAAPPRTPTARPPVVASPGGRAPSTQPATVPPGSTTSPPPAGPSAPPPVEAVGPLPFLPPPPGAGGDGTGLVEAPRSTPKETPHSEGRGSRWWLWTGLAVVVVGGGVAGYLLLRPKDQPVPQSSLGNFNF